MTLPVRPAAVARALMLLALLSTLLQPPAGAAQRRRIVPQRPAGALPLDPLTPAEKERAERVAAEDARVRELLGDGPRRLVYVEFFALKPDDRGQAEERQGRPVRIGRHAEVLFYARALNQGVRAVVDLERGRVREVARLDGDDVPLTPDDVEEARALALRDAAVRRLLGADAERFRVRRERGLLRAEAAEQTVVEALRVRSEDANDPCSRERCLLLLFRRGRAYVRDASIVVNLTAQNVRLERRRR